MHKSEKAYKSNGFHQAQALSIVSVIIYYLWPKIFPNAILGIDIFFVTSGYIMSSHKPLNTTKRLIKYYFKHIKMLIPMHLIAVLIIMLISSYLLGTSYFINISGDGMLAMAFTQNLNIYFQKYNLFNLMEETAYFLHTWLLCNQLAFCLFAPFISYFNFQTQSSVSCFVGIFFLSFFLQFYYSLGSNYYVTFFPNFWQYLIGASIFLLSKNPKYQNIPNLAYINKLKSFIVNNNRLYISSLFLLLCGIWNPYQSKFLFIVTRIVASFATGTLILSYPAIQCNNIADKLISYISNAFYSLYVTSLAIIFFAHQIGIIRLPCKFLSVNCDDVDNLISDFKFALVFITFVVSITVHELIQKPLQHLSNNGTILLVGSLYILISYFCFYLITYPPD